MRHALLQTIILSHDTGQVRRKGTCIVSLNMPVAICAEFQVEGVSERPDVTREYKSQCYAFGPLAGDAGPNAS